MYLELCSAKKKKKKKKQQKNKTHIFVHFNASLSHFAIQKEKLVLY